MRIVYITPEFVTEPNSYDGGVSNHVYKLAAGVKGLGHEPIVIVNSTENNEITYNGIKVFQIKSSPGKVFKLVDFITRFKFYRLLIALQLSYDLRSKLYEINNEKKVDIVQYSSDNGIAFFKPKKIPSVLLGASHLKEINISNGLINKGFVERQMEIVNDLILRKYNNIYVPSFYLKNILNKNLNVKSKVIETPFQEKKIILENTFYNEIRTKTNNIYFLYFGRLLELKGVLELTDILPQLLEKYPKVSFVFVGKDKSYNGKPMKDYILNKCKNFNSRVFLFPNMSQENLFSIIKESYGVVLPSRVENLSNASIETMSMGKILIGTRGASFDQLINDGENGFLCEINNSKSILESIEKALELDKKSKTKMENKAKETTKRLHPNIVINQLIEYYKKVKEQN